MSIACCSWHSRSYLAPPADISESAAYWESPPCALCGRAVWPDSASGCYMHWCDRCARADSEQTERHTRQEQEWRQQEYQRRMRELSLRRMRLLFHT